jgi:ABC transporter substrate binding protein (PQQ-dependent alcohol dehydrogenase system)
VWSAVRIIGEGVTRTNSTGDADIADYIRGRNFEFAGYKGQKMSFRSWNLQLRQPILLTAPRSLVSVSPQRQFLHQRSALDTLGYDRQETSCQLEEEATR